MRFKAWFKSKTADRVLAPVREAIIDLMDEDCRVLEVGCGTGDLLFRAANKIRTGLGIDLDSAMIEFANQKKQRLLCDNLAFVCEDINTKKDLQGSPFDIATSTLCLHEMQVEDAVTTLKTFGRHALQSIIADYGRPDTRWGKISIELDEMLSGHYGRFRRYRDTGGITELAGRAGLTVESVSKSPVDGIFLWRLRRLQPGASAE